MPLNLQKKAAVKIGALFGAVDDQLPRQRRKAAIEIGAPFYHCQRSAQDEEGKPPLRIGACLKSSGLEARFEGCRGAGRDFEDFQGVFVSDVETHTALCAHNDPCRQC